MLIDMKEVIGAESKFNKGVSISDGELKILARFYSDMVEYHSGDKLLKAHFRAEYNKVIDLIDIRKLYPPKKPAPKTPRPRQGTFEYLVDIAKERGILVERNGRKVEWWQPGTGVESEGTIAEAIAEIEPMPVV